MRIGHITRYDTHRQVTTFGVMKQPFITFVSVLMRLFAAFSNADVGKKVIIAGNSVLIDDKVRIVDWADAKHSNMRGYDQKRRPEVQGESGA